MEDIQQKAKQFLELATADDVAAMLDTTYKELSLNCYDTPSRYRYKEFELQKKTGGKRLISCPNRKIKEYQRKLADIIAELYVRKPPVHGFVKNRSIFTNAKQHLNKRFIFNIDLQDFYPSIHFGRVRNLFINKPYLLPLAPATVVAHICCHKGVLPQGAPTSPIISNVICAKMDSALQKMAKKYNCTYTRYADDITFSFSCKRNRLPRDIVSLREGELTAGPVLDKVVIENGFRINDSKTRLCASSQRLEVTGLTVNEFPNVRRAYVRQIAAMLHAWEKFGYEAAEAEYKDKYYLHKRRSDVAPSFLNVIKGKLAFLYMLIGDLEGLHGAVYSKLAKRYNKLLPRGKKPLPIRVASSAEKYIFDSLWIIETEFESAVDHVGDGKMGTGFMLKDIGIVTCAHILYNFADGQYGRIYAYRHDRVGDKYILRLKKVSKERDLAALDLVAPVVETASLPYFVAAREAIKQNEDVFLYGFPAYRIGQTPNKVKTHVSSIYGDMGVSKFEIAAQIRNGNSGGPVLNSRNEVVGIAAAGAEKTEGKNAVIAVSELRYLLEDGSNILG